MKYSGITKIVEAEYSHNDQFPGNPLVEALPAPRSAVEIFNDAQKEIPNFDYDKLIHSPISVQIGHLIRLRSVNYVVPYQPVLENAFHMALVNSYSNRQYMESNTYDLKVKVDNGVEIPCKRIVVGDPASGAFGGFALIGDSGSGKTTAIKILTSGYPQVLVHPHADGTTSRQILYIVVNCPVRSNFRALLGIVGTKYSKNKLFDMVDESLKSHRRFGPEIPSDDYCKDKDFVFAFIKWLFRCPI